jgi:hypothetical protein
MSTWQLTVSAKATLAATTSATVPAKTNNAALRFMLCSYPFRPLL